MTRNLEPADGPATVTFIVPAYNEAATIGEVLERIDALGFDAQVIVVDDGSTDGTGDVVERGRPGAATARVRQANRGKGAAIRAAIPHVDGDIAVIQDADMEYDPADVPALIEPIERGAADVVFGSRLSGGQPQRAYLFWHLVGNRFLSLAHERALQHDALRHGDRLQGVPHRRPALARPARERLRRSSRRSPPRSASASCGSTSCRSPTTAARYAEGKKITWRDGFKAIWVLLRLRVFD